MSARGLKSQDSRKAIPSHNNASTEQRNRKGGSPRRCQAVEQSSESLTSWLCKNSACRAFMSGDDSFCRRCSCCICHRYDDIKDPTLWLVCAESSDSCVSSCHIECAFRLQKVGVVDPGRYMGLDGNYCCPSCGKVTEIIRFCKTQLEKAIDASCIDALCYRLLLSYRLLDGTYKFKELLEVVKEANDMLEAEVGPLDRGHDTMAIGIVTGLPNRTNIHKLFFKAVKKCEEWLAVSSDTGGKGRVDSLPAACRFLFQEITSSSVFLFLVEIPILLSECIKEFKLWYCKSRTEMYPEEPLCTLSSDQTRVLISDLESCTEYSFRVVSYAENGEVCQSEAKCFTRRKDVPDLNEDVMLPVEEENHVGQDVDYSEALNVRKRALSAIEPHDCNSTLLNNGSSAGPSGQSGILHEKFEDWVKIVFNLEREDYITSEFRQRFLTWYSLGCTEQERRVANAFFENLEEDQRSLAGQLLYSFDEIIPRKRQK